MSDKDRIDFAGPTGRELPGEHWNARILREQAAADRNDCPMCGDSSERFIGQLGRMECWRCQACGWTWQTRMDDEPIDVADLGIFPGASYGAGLAATTQQGTGGQMEIQCCGIWIDYPTPGHDTQCSVCHSTFHVQDCCPDFNTRTTEAGVTIEDHSVGCPAVTRC